ncbi:MAG: hypothetical protein E6J60_13480 [Deltaproteobacteria bacterium]|nr:MAG: hypothetical protein E6J60_13480 [Deltaproteobacteria bacterium]
MPIVEKDPWRAQYFVGVACPEEVVIPTDDQDAYRLHPAHRWIYNKLLICETQGLEHGPHGIAPSRFPVFSKPIYNLRGMGVGGKIIRTRAEYDREQAPGHLWMPVLDGAHVSSDVAVVDGEPVWWRHVTGLALGDGTFDYWTVLAEPLPAIEAYGGEWLRRHLRGYSGFVNLETIGGTIIEAHLRFADQWVDLYGAGWVESVVELYAHGRWCFADSVRRVGYSVVLFGQHGVRWAVDPAEVDGLRHVGGVSSIQITFHTDRPPDAHAMPPGGFRLAIVNCWDLAVGVLVRERLTRMFRSADVRDAAVGAR